MSSQTNCESCGAALTPGAKVCDSCGQPVSGGAGADQVSAASWSQPSAPAPISSQPSSTDRWGSQQSNDSADDPGRWGSPQPKPVSAARPQNVSDSDAGSFDADSAIAGVKETARKSRKWLLIGGAVLLLGCLCLVAALVLSGGALFSFLSTAAGGGY
jgi:hypothetical protein